MIIEITRKEAEKLKEKGIKITDRSGNDHIILQGLDLVVNPDYADTANPDG